jgi:hypothetical protein
MRRTRKRKQQEYVFRRSQELAMSGKFSRWMEIEFALRFEEGCGEARQWLDSPSIRDELDRLCKQAQARKDKMNA